MLYAYSESCVLNIYIFYLYSECLSSIIHMKYILYIKYIYHYKIINLHLIKDCCITADKT